MVKHSLDPPPFKGRGVNFDYPSQRGESENFQKRDGSMVLGQVFLKGEGLALFLFVFFQGLWFLHLEITLPFAKLCHAFEEKLFFSATIILSQKVILSYLKYPIN